ncbi:hypothetical protein pb186bvf_020185 [Paramecium bursaria]
MSEDVRQEQVNRKKHKIINSDEEEVAVAPPKPKPKVKIDAAKYIYLFEPDTSADPPPKKKEKIQEQPKVRKEKDRDNEVKAKQFEDLRNEILIRWWYCFEDWPPKDYDYAAQLNRYKLRRVDQNNFKKEPEFVDGKRKVYEIDGFPGVYRTSLGDALDLRPQETCPSSKNIENIGHRLLPKIYLKGLKAQLKDLQQYEPQNTQLANRLQQDIDSATRNYKKYLD